MSNTWFYADSHLRHTNIIKYCNRPFSSVQEMDEELIHRWNLLVKPNDVVYHLGDFSFGNTRYYRDRLNGKIHLIKGNHDKKVDKSCFESVRDMAVIELDGEHIVLCHYPLTEWEGFYRGYYHLHGHCHGTVKGVGKRIDVGVDCWKFSPVSFDEVKRRSDERDTNRE